MARRESRDVWAKRVERWQDSGLTAREFAAELGINHRTLSFWKYQLAKEGARPRPTAKPRRVQSRRSTETPRFVAAQVRESSVFEVQVGDVLLRLPADVDAQRVAELIGAVRSA